MSTLTRELVFDQLEMLGIASVRVGFQWRDDGVNVEGISCVDSVAHEVTVEINWRSPLFDGLCQPICDRYLGFDGDSEVEGELTWRVIGRSLAIEVSEKKPQPFREPLPLAQADAASFWSGG